MGVMQSEANLPTGVDELVEQIVSSRRITKADQMRMMSALLAQNCISDREQRQINRVFEALRSGLIRVVD
jgi:hypothetical protein